jgi:ribosomal protein S18 acetylase RimI-like enzyme
VSRPSIPANRHDRTAYRAGVIRAATSDDEDRIVELSLRAWEPVFASMAEVVGPTLFPALFTDDWRRYQEDDVRRACRTYRVWVAEEDGEVAGFTAVDLPDGEPHGEIYMLAVDPNQQSKGVGLQLTQHAIDRIQEAGRSLVIVNTGGDPGHAPARATYERAGFTAMPSVSYYLQV